MHKATQRGKRSRGAGGRDCSDAAASQERPSGQKPPEARNRQGRQEKENVH